MANPKRTRFNSGNGIQKKLAKTLDDLAEFEEFQSEILPKLRLGIKQGKSAEDIYKMVEAHLAARTVTIALTELDSGKAMTAIQEALNRAKGKPKERVETTQKFSKLSDEELDQLVESKLAGAQDELEDDTQAH